MALFDGWGSGIIPWAPSLFQGTEVLRGQEKQFSKIEPVMDRGYPCGNGGVWRHSRPLQVKMKKDREKSRGFDSVYQKRLTHETEKVKV